MSSQGQQFALQLPMGDEYRAIDGIIVNGQLLIANCQ